MKKIHRLFLLLGLSFCTIVSYAQEVSVVPYRVVANKMIIDIKLNGKVVPMIFDTGGKNAITTALKTELGTEVIDSRVIMDANSNKKQVDIVKISQVETSDAKASYKDIPFVVVDNELFTCLGVGGLIASDLWQNNTIEIDDQRKEIRITVGGIASLKNNKQAIPFVANADGAPIFSLGVGKFDELRVLFDSGAVEFLTVTGKEYPRLEQQGALYMVRQGKGGGSLGVAGRSKIIGNRFLLQVPELIVGETSFTKLRVSVGNSHESLMGYKALQYGKITIDYVNKLFLFAPNKPGKIALEADLKKNWDLEVREQDNQLIVGTVWNEMEGQAEVGDIVTQVDGKEIKSITFCESMTTGIPSLKEKDQVILTIRTKAGLKNITINRN